MKKAKKVLLLLMCAVLLVGMTIMGTVAYLTDTKSVTNTFTVGNVAIELKEHDMNPGTGELVDKNDQTDGIQTGYASKALENIKVVPGRKIMKQPVVIVGSESEKCWLFVKVDGSVLNYGKFTCANGWSAVEGSSGWYKMSTEATAGVYQVFESFDVNTDADMTALSGETTKTIVVTAYAVQAEGMEQQQALAVAQNPPANS